MYDLKMLTWLYMIGYGRGKGILELPSFLIWNIGASRAGNTNENRNTSQLLRSVTLL